MARSGPRFLPELSLAVCLRGGSSTGREQLKPKAHPPAHLEMAGTFSVTSNLPFDEWTEVFGSERLTGALLDRLTHHVHILEINGDSYRLNQSKMKLRPAQRPSLEDNGQNPEPSPR